MQSKECPFPIYLEPWLSLSRANIIIFFFLKEEEDWTRFLGGWAGGV